jgi:hypothetical protein
MARMSETMMTVAFAKALGVKPTQVKYWTDSDALRCLPGTKGAGQGNKRLYSADYLPEAAIIAEIAKYRIPIKYLAHWSKEIEKLLAHGEEKRFKNRKPAEWYRAALAGEHESHIIFLIPRQIGGEIGDQFGWHDPETLAKALRVSQSAITVNVGAVVQRFKP